MTQAEWWEKAQSAYIQQGYVVLHSRYPKRVGEVLGPGYQLTNFEIPQPFMIIAEATLEDYQRQHVLSNIPLIGEPPIPSYFYKMVTE